MKIGIGKIGRGKSLGISIKSFGYETQVGPVKSFFLQSSIQIAESGSYKYNLIMLHYKTHLNQQFLGCFIVERPSHWLRGPGQN